MKHSTAIGSFYLIFTNFKQGMCLCVKPASFFFFRFIGILYLKSLPNPEAVDKADPQFNHSILSLATSLLLGLLLSFPIRLGENVFVTPSYMSS